MFSYQNKVVGIKVTGKAQSDLFDILINSGYVGSTTGSGQGDGGYFVGSSDSSLSLIDSTTGIGGYPSRIFFEYDGYLGAISGSVNNAAYPLSGYYPLPLTNYILQSSGSGYPWQLNGVPGIVAVGGTNPQDPHGAYEDATYDGEVVTISSATVDTAKTPIYYFSNLALNEGLNEISFINSLNNGTGNLLNYEISLYELSGSYLINPSSIASGNISPTTGGSSGVTFNLQYPTPGGTITLSEFDPAFSIDTGNLNQIFTGSGVHLQKDVTLFFDILDQQLNAISSNQQFLENPLISGCVFDILNINGTTVAENFFTGKFSRSVTVSELDNENIFGTYQKNFGVRCKLPNSFDGSIFTGVFLAYGNVPNILDIVPNYAEFSGAPQATESFSSAIVLQNDLRFTQMDRYDVYGLTGSGSAVNELTYLNPTAQEGYIFSQSAINTSNAYTLKIDKGALIENTPYYFTVVPYGALGSGKSFVFGPSTFVPKQTNLLLPTADVSAVNIYDGSGFSSTVYKTGSFTSDTSILHQFSSGDFSSVKYFVEIYNGTVRQLSELKGVVNTSGLHLTSEPVNDTATTYLLTGITSGLCSLRASGAGYSGSTYKLQATML
jgi:hypothetical protein